MVALEGEVGERGGLPVDGGWPVNCAHRGARGAVSRSSLALPPPPTGLMHERRFPTD